MPDLGLRLGRDAQQGRRRRDGERGRGRGDDLRRHRRRDAARRRRAASGSVRAFVPHTDRAPSFKLWLRYAAPARGRIVVDDGAGRGAAERGSSLLPVGVVDVEGEFAAGDPVEVVAGDELIGKGIAEHSSADPRPA